MNAVRSYVSIIFFSILASSVAIYSFFTSIKESTEIKKEAFKLKNNSTYSLMKNLKYYTTENKKRVFELKSLEMRLENENNFQEHTRPSGVFYTKKGVSVNYESTFGVVDQNNSEVLLTGEVKFSNLDSLVTSDEAQYFLKKDIYHARGNVVSKHVTGNAREVVEVKSDEFRSHPKARLADYIGNVEGKITRKLVYERPIIFKSHTVSIDGKESRIDLKGDVTIKKQGITAQGLKGEIYLKNRNKKLKYYILYDDVKVEEKVRLKSGKMIKRRAFAERLEGYSLSEKIVLTGAPKVVQGKDIVKGNVITLRHNNESFEVDDASTILKLD